VHESLETKGYGWIDAEVRKINNINKKLKLPHMGWNEIELKKDCILFSNLKNKSHMYFIHSYELITKQKDCIVATLIKAIRLLWLLLKKIFLGHNFIQKKVKKMV